MQIILASSSPRRQELLKNRGYNYIIEFKDIDESFCSDVNIYENVERISKNKAFAVRENHYHDIIIGCDTIVCYLEEVYTKPKDFDEAFKTLRTLSGKTHEVISGVCILYKDKIYNFHVISHVSFKDLSDYDIINYINTGECFGKAGAYAIQGIGSTLIKEYKGSLENIIGLPIDEVSEILDEILQNKGFYIRDIKIDNKLVLAPMAGITNEAFRLICKDYNASLTVGEMLSDKAITFKNEKTLKMSKINEKEHPISMQIFGSDEKSMVEAAKFIDLYTDADIIDINMGCPVNKVCKKSKAGASLLIDPNKVYQITKSVVDSVSKPVSVKIRSGWDFNSINAVENAKMIEKAGASLITVHGRTRSQLYSGSADLEIIKKVKESVSIPVIGNGDISSYESCKKMLEYTKCDAVMIGRKALGNPFIFKEIYEKMYNNVDIERPSYNEIFKVIERHYYLLLELKGAHLATLEMRSHIGWYLKGMKNSSAIKDEINKLKSIDEVFVCLRNYFNYLNELSN